MLARKSPLRYAALGMAALALLVGGCEAGHQFNGEEVSGAAVLAGGSILVSTL